MTYQIASGYNNVAGYADLDPQPACKGIEYVFADSPVGRVPISGGFAFLVYNNLQASEFDAILTTTGLNNVYYKEITISLPIDDRTFADFNAIIHYPSQRNYEKFYQNIVFPLTNIEEI